MTDVNEKDTGLNRLGKLVPSYIIAVITSLQPSLEFLHNEFPGWDYLFLGLVLFGVFGFYILIDIYTEKVRRVGQIVFTVIVITLYSIQTFIAVIFVWPTPIKVIISGATILITLASPYIIKGGPKYMRFKAYEAHKVHTVLADPATITNEEKTYIVFFNKAVLQKFQRDPTLYAITAVANNMHKLTYSGGPNWEIVYDDQPNYVGITIDELAKASGKEQAYLAVFDKG